MDPARWLEIKRVFNGAADLSRAERSAYIDAACSRDADLRDEVNRLLNQHDAADGFMREDGTSLLPANAADAESAPAAAAGGAIAGGRIGSFELVQVIGEGGMGVVYLARQERPRRTVALKVIKPGIATPALLRRFEHEAQVLGRLQHPGIAQIFEAGTADAGSGPQPYFAMELVEGKPLLEHAEEAGLDVRGRLALFVLVCDAVQHAHQKGVIHRDLKPANILVSSGAGSAVVPTGVRPTQAASPGQPKILDFGVARVTDLDVQVTTMRTDIGQLIGTLPYMSPEQVLGDSAELDTRSDVYSLGVVLYEMLTGRLPYPVKSRGIAEAARIIREAEPTPASAVLRSLRGDVDTILAKALEKEKTRRYQSAAELAGDIRRHLASEPITARPPSTLYQIRTFARRNRTLVGVVAAAFMALVLGIAGTTWQAVAATHQRDRARAEADKAAAISKFLRDLLEEADPINSKGEAMTVRQALDRASAKIDASFKDNPEIEGAVRDTIGNTYVMLGLFNPALEHLERAVELLTGSVGRDHPDTLEAMNNLALLYREFNRWDDVERLLSEVVQRSTRALGPEHTFTLSAMNNMAKLLAARGKPEEAEQLLRRVVDVRKRVLGPDHRKTLISTDNLAMVLQQEKKYEGAEGLFREVHAAMERTLGPDDPDTIVSMHSLAAVLLDEKRLDEAEGLFRRVITDRERVEGPAHLRTASSRMYLARVLMEEGRAEEAEPLCRNALNIARTSLAPGSVVAAQWSADLGRCLMLLGRHKEAEAALLESLGGLRAAPAPPANHIRRTIEYLRDLYLATGQEAKSAEYQAMLAEQRMLDH